MQISDSESEQQQRRSQRKGPRLPKWLRSPRVFKTIVLIALTVVRVLRLIIAIWTWLSG